MLKQGGVLPRQTASRRQAYKPQSGPGVLPYVALARSTSSGQAPVVTTDLFGLTPTARKRAVGNPQDLTGLSCHNIRPVVSLPCCGSWGDHTKKRYGIPLVGLESYSADRQ